MPSKGKTKAKDGVRDGKMAPQTGKTSSNGEVKAPNWPVLRPLVPQADLSLETLLEDQIVLIHKFFTSSLCQQYVSFLSSLPLTTTPGQPKRGEAVRVNDRFQIQDAAFAEQLWSGTSLRSLVLDSGIEWGGQVCGLNPNIRIYRYRKGQFFDQHYDETNLVTLPNADGGAPLPARTTWTLLIYLTGPTTGCVGGETVFYPEDNDSATKSAPKSAGTGPGPGPVAVAPEVGLALLHKHGNDCLLHEGKLVGAGEKWIIRSDLCVNR